jgi:hypothetical protein
MSPHLLRYPRLFATASLTACQLVVLDPSEHLREPRHGPTASASRRRRRWPRTVTIAASRRETEETALPRTALRPDHTGHPALRREDEPGWKRSASRRAPPLSRPYLRPESPARHSSSGALRSRPRHTISSQDGLPTVGCRHKLGVRRVDRKLRQPIHHRAHLSWNQLLTSGTIVPADRPLRVSPQCRLQPNPSLQSDPYWRTPAST